MTKDPVGDAYSAEQVAAALDAARQIVNNDGYAFMDQATAFGCSEIEPVADLFRALGKGETADEIIAAHASGDEPGDAHYDGPDA